MTLAKTVSMVFPSKNHGGIRIILTDDKRPDLGPGPQTVIDEAICEHYSGDITQEITDVLRKRAQEKIDEYRKLWANNDAQSYKDVAGTISGQLDLTKVIK